MTVASSHKKSALRASLVCLILLGAVFLGLSALGRNRAGGVLTASARAASPPVVHVEETAAAQEDEGGISVTTVRPKRDPSFSTSVEQPAYVEAYYQADLMARVAGPVKSVVADIGDRVKAGEALVEIDAPDLQEDVLQKDAVVQQRLRELDLAQANVRMAAAAVDAAGGAVKVREGEVLRSEANCSFREKELRRFKGLASGPSPAVTQDVLDERTQFYEAAVADCAASRAAVLKAKGDLEEAKGKLEATRADVKLKEALVEVARKDKDKAKALFEFATVRAPFEGVITHRNTDPGSFVQNATAHPQALLTLARTDIVTVFMKVPDNFAPFVNRDTEARIQMSSLPGVVIRAKVTRYSPSLLNPEHDRTMRVEVDLYNGSAAEYAAFVAREKATGNADLKSRRLPSLPTLAGGQTRTEALGLLPGQYGKMRLVLRSFQKAYLLPSSAVFSQGGTSYVFVVKDGRAIKVPVEIQVDNGRTVKLVLLETVGGAEVRRDLSGDEEIVASNQGELSNGQAVRITRVDW
jgi:multidrug resistance efflux pump